MRFGGWKFLPRRTDLFHQPAFAGAGWLRARPGNANLITVSAFLVVTLPFDVAAAAGGCGWKGEFLLASIWQSDGERWLQIFQRLGRRLVVN